MGSELNPFLPSHQSNGHHNFFELDIKKYASPCWWTLACGWISFLPLMPSLCSPIFEKLYVPRSHHYVFNEELGKYTMPSNLSKKNGYKWTKIFLMPSTSFVATTQFPLYIPSIHFASAIPKAMRGLEHCTWLYVRGMIGLLCGWHFCLMSSLEPKTFFHQSRTQSPSPSHYGLIFYLSTLISSGLMPFMLQLSAHFLKHCMLGYFSNWRSSILTNHCLNFFVSSMSWYGIPGVVI